MRKVLSLAVCFVLLSAAAAHAEPSIAVFNVQKVANECEALKEAKAALDKKFGAQKQAIDKQREALERKAQGLKGKVTEKQQAELNKMHKAYTEKAQAFVRVFQADELTLRKDIDTLMTNAAKELAARKGYALILDSQAAVFAEPQLDVTDAMLAETNELWKKNKKTPPVVEDGKDSATKDAGEKTADPKDGAGDKGAGAADEKDPKDAKATDGKGAQNAKGGKGGKGGKNPKPSK